MRQSASRLFLTLGIVLFLFFGYLLWERTTPKRLSFAVTGNSFSKDVSSGDYPQGILIPRVGISLPIIPATLHGNEWEATKEGVSFLTSSPIPGTTGNSILYGHNWQNLLGSLPKVRPGDTIRILFSKGVQREFIVEYTSVVTPDQTHVLGASADKRLTIYTCTGFFDTKRFVVTAILKEPPLL